MGIARRFGIAAALAGLLFMSERALARPEGGLPPVPVNAERMEKLKRFYFKLGYGERVRTDVRERILRVVDGDRKAADALIAKVPWGPIDDLLIRELGGWVDDRTLNEMLAFLDSNEGQKAITLLRIDRSLASIQTLFAVEKERSGSGRLRQAYEDLLSRSWGPPKAPEVPSDAKAPKDSVKPPEARSDVTKIEEAALKDLIAIVSCQAQMQFSGKIDLDGDTVGEFSTLLELTGGVGLRRSPDAVSKGKKQEPPILSSEFANVDANGVATRNGYCFRVFLPDSPHDRKPGFVHEVGPASVGGLSGGSRRIDPDGAEVM